MREMTFYKRVAAYLSQYVAAEDGGELPPNPVYIRDAISLLISNGTLSKEQMQSEALEMFDVVIPDRFFMGGGGHG